MHSYSVALRIQLEGKVDFTNSAGGIVGFNGVGNVNLNAGGDVTILNQGEVRGTTFAQSSGGKSASNSSYASITVVDGKGGSRSEEHTSELQSLMRISYAVFCLKKKRRIQLEKKHNRK